MRSTVVGTVASASYAVGMIQLAKSARGVGFACIVVQPFDWFADLGHELVVPLPVPSPTLKPRGMWCRPPYLTQYGWRRSQLYRTRMWRVVLELNLDLLAVDLDHQLGPFNPLHFLHNTLAPAERKAKGTAAQQPGPADVVAVWDGPTARYLNVGIMWLRSTPGTVELARRAENRSFSGWEQAVFNEEINFNGDLLNVRCCHTSCLRKLLTTSMVAKQLPGKDAKSTLLRGKSEGTDRCSEDQPPAASPPRDSPERWAHGGRWKTMNETLRAKHSSSRKFGRCNNELNVCLHLSTDGVPRRALHNCTSIAAYERNESRMAGTASVQGSPTTSINVSDGRSSVL